VFWGTRRLHLPAESTIYIKMGSRGEDGAGEEELAFTDAFALSHFVSVLGREIKHRNNSELLLALT
jgi:hypothetical protein